VESLGGAAKVQLLGDGYEIAKVAEFHGFPIQSPATESECEPQCDAVRVPQQTREPHT
jgi:hypothetical protein